MGFEAAATSPLDFSFRPYTDVTGTIPDPSETKVRAFFAALDKVRSDADAAKKRLTDVGEDGDAKEISDDLLAEIDGVTRTLHEQTLDAIAELCGGTPSREQLAELPYRVQGGFYEWLEGELRNPTMLPATKPPLAAVR